MTHKTFVYPAKVEKDGDASVISFRDIPEANWFASQDEDVVQEAAKALAIAIGYYFEEGKRIPSASKKKDGEILVNLPPSFVAKIILHNIMLENGVRPADLARRMGVSTSEVARITGCKWKTKIDTMAEAINACGGSLQLVC